MLGGADGSFSSATSGVPNIIHTWIGIAITPPKQIDRAASMLEGSDLFIFVSHNFSNNLKQYFKQEPREA